MSWPLPQSRDLRSFDTPYSKGIFTQLHPQGLGHEGAGFTAEGGGGGSDLTLADLTRHATHTDMTHTHMAHAHMTHTHTTHSETASDFRDSHSAASTHTHTHSHAQTPSANFANSLFFHRLGQGGGVEVGGGEEGKRMAVKAAREDASRYLGELNSMKSKVEHLVLHNEELTQHVASLSRELDLLASDNAQVRGIESCFTEE